MGGEDGGKAGRGQVTIGCFPGGSVVTNSPASAEDPRDTGSIPGSGRSPK